MIVILQGSPNPMGNTNQVLEEIIKESNEECIYFDAYKNPIKSCTDCKYCSFKKGCKNKDDMITIYDAIDKADTLIITSPLYFATLTGELINMLSRFQTYYSGKYERHDSNPTIKKAFFLVTAGGSWPTMFQGVIETFKIIQSLFNINETRSLFIPNCDTIPPINSSEYVSQKIELKQFLS